MMKPVTAIEEIQHLVKESNGEIIEQIQAYIDNQLIFLQESNEKSTAAENRLQGKEAF